MKLLLAIILLPLAVGVSCASTQEILDSWLSNSTDDLIAAWGIPDKHMEFKGVEYFEYDRCGRGSVYLGNNLTVGPGCNAWKFEAEQGQIVRDSVNR